MRLYIKGDYSKKIPFGYKELAQKMWFKERKGHELEFSNVGDDEMLQDDFLFGVELRKWGTVDERWSDASFVVSDNPWLSLEYENIGLEFEKAFISDYRERGECLRIASGHVDILTVDKRALFIMAIEVASAIDGQISEDEKQSWLNVEEFQKRHQDVLSLTYDEAVDISLEELKVMKAVDEPLWEEEERLHEEYIKIHGERVYDDDDFEDEEDE
ncbi:hypothetical protein [Streptococcus cristatus]|uniref:Uncharacterized protein n=1 Tax=Streptococcus cristatus TaxID=45634 RepID=A0A139N1H5_STRCR|nr:hypothetical protein [Streptococcus cristatus]KXT69792.1 hypothetical protein SCRDD08_01066 [Streptococcus cristatus]